MELLRDPVVAADGFTCGSATPKPLSSRSFARRYERSSIEAWFQQGKMASPKSGGQLPSTALVPNHDLRAQVQEFTQQRGL